MSPRDPRFLELTEEEIEAEYWAHYYADNAGKGEEVEDDELDVDALMNALDESDGAWEEVISG